MLDLEVVEQAALARTGLAERSANRVELLDIDAGRRGCGESRRLWRLDGLCGLGTAVRVGQILTGIDVEVG